VLMSRSRFEYNGFNFRLARNSDSRDDLYHQLIMPYYIDSDDDAEFGIEEIFSQFIRDWLPDEVDNDVFSIDESLSADEFYALNQSLRHFDRIRLWSRYEELMERNDEEGDTAQSVEEFDNRRNQMLNLVGNNPYTEDEYVQVFRELNPFIGMNDDEVFIGADDLAEPYVPDDYIDDMVRVANLNLRTGPRITRAEIIEELENERLYREEQERKFERYMKEVEAQGLRELNEAIRIDELRTKYDPAR